MYIALVGRGEDATRLYDRFVPIDPYAAVEEVPVIIEPEMPDEGEAPQMAE